MIRVGDSPSRQADELTAERDRGSELRYGFWPEADRQDGDPLAYRDVLAAFWPGSIAQLAPPPDRIQTDKAPYSLIGMTTYRV
jgi:hypothetical protein